MSLPNKVVEILYYFCNSKYILIYYSTVVSFSNIRSRTLFISCEVNCGYFSHNSFLCVLKKALQSHCETIAFGGWHVAFLSVWTFFVNKSHFSIFDQIWIPLEKNCQHHCKTRLWFFSLDCMFCQFLTNLGITLAIAVNAVIGLNWNNFKLMPFAKMIDFNELLLKNMALNKALLVESKMELDGNITKTHSRCLEYLPSQ